MRIIDATDQRALNRFLERTETMDRRVAAEAHRIVTDVRRHGDPAVLKWARRLDDPSASGRFEMTSRELRRGWDATSPDVRRAIKRALKNIRTVSKRQLPRPFVIGVQAGVTIEQRVAPLGRVGCYVPGGRYPLPSTVLMTVAPAAVAGVGDITVTCPQPAPAVLCAALEAGATRVLRLGGAQAIAALAYGTRSIARVDKIVGPGNAWVAAAKALVSSDCAIDFQAGPSEIVVWSDTAQPDWIAADLLAQAEHDPAARAIFVTSRRSLARAVAVEVRSQTPATGPAGASIARNGAAIVASSKRDAAEIVDRIAPEHLVCDRPEDANNVRHAGTVFVGRWSAQATGDYVTGSNHVLPTGGSARFRGGLSSADFARTFTVQTLTSRGLRSLAPSAIALARAEGLHAHARSIEIRL